MTFVELSAEIRRLHSGGHLPARAIAKRLGVSRHLVLSLLQRPRVLRGPSIIDNGLPPERALRQRGGGG